MTITYAKANGPPHNWRTLRIFDGAKELKRVIEVDTIKGVATLYHCDENIGTMRGLNDFRIIKINSPNLRIVE